MNGADHNDPFPFTHVSALLEPPPPLRWLVRDYLLPESLALLFGDPAAGKSLLALRWAAELALAGFFVVIIAGEGHFGLRRRLKALAQHLGKEEALRQAPLVISETGAAFIEPDSLRAVTAAIALQAQEYGAPALIIVDTLHRNLGAGDENSSKDMGQFVQAADTLRTQFDAAVLVIHHCGHHNKDRARGSSSLWGAVDTELKLTEFEGERVLEVTKMKDAPTPEPVGFTVTQVTLPWQDEEGNPETSVVLVPTGAPVAPKKSKLSPNAHLAFQTLSAALETHGTDPTWETPAGEPLPSKVVHVEDWRAGFYGRHDGKNADSKRKAFNRARTDLTKVKAIDVREGYYWPMPQPSVEDLLKRRI
jgi:AAA domain